MPHNHTCAPALLFVCAGQSSDGSSYEWAIVSGGPPSTSSKDGCVVGPLNPGPQDVNNSGTLRVSKAAHIMRNCALTCGVTCDDSLYLQ
jgi:hypothetical protein